MSAVLDAPTPKKFTPDDLLRMPDEGKGFELVNGELKELNVSFLSNFVAGEVYGALRDHAKPRRLGWISREGTSFQCFSDDPDRVRRADVALHRLDRLTTEQATAEGHMRIVPDMVVEVISPNDLAYEVNEKRKEWLSAGVQLVWVIDPVRQIIQAFRADRRLREFERTDIVTAEPVLPDFQVPASDLFKLPTEA